MTTSSKSGTPKKPDAYTFIHEIWITEGGTVKQSYHPSVPRTSSKKKNWAAQHIISEASRIEGHCKHVKRPLPPVHRYGTPLDDLVPVAKSWANARTIDTGETYRRNQPFMTGGVISLPNHMQSEWDSFRDDCIAYLQRRFGARLRCVVEHTDEAHPHIHYYAVPLFENEPGKTVSAEPFGVIHPGYEASRRVRKDFEELYGKPRPDENGKWSKGAPTRRAHNTAMSEMIDHFHEQVGSHYGLKRIGPKQKRMSYEEALQAREIREAEALATQDLQQKEQERDRVQQELQQLEDRLQASRKEENELRQSMLNMQKIQRNFNEEKQALKERVEKAALSERQMMQREKHQLDNAARQRALEEDLANKERKINRQLARADKQDKELTARLTEIEAQELDVAKALAIAEGNAAKIVAQAKIEADTILQVGRDRCNALLEKARQLLPGTSRTALAPFEKLLAAHEELTQARETIAQHEVVGKELDLFKNRHASLQASFQNSNDLLKEFTGLIAEIANQPPVLGTLPRVDDLLKIYHFRMNVAHTPPASAPRAPDATLPAKIPAASTKIGLPRPAPRLAAKVRY